MGFQKATRQNIWLKVAVSGVSGSGKTWGLLELATGVAKKMREVEKLNADDPTGRIAFIDTENGRGKYYANDFDYDYMALSAPYTPESYIVAIDDALRAGYKTIVIDSTSHEWSGEGGCLEIHSKIPGNSYTAWQTVTPRHKAFIEKIISSPAHVFVSVRSKDEVVIEEVNGKKVPKKVGVGVDQRGQFEYEYTVTFEVDRDRHIATAGKDNTNIFDQWNEMLKATHGEMLYDWANSGSGKNMKVVDVKPKIEKAEKPADAPAPVQQVEENFDSVLKEIDDLKNKLIGTKRDALMEAVTAAYPSQNGNYKKLAKDSSLTNDEKLEIAVDMRNRLNKLKESK